MSLLRDGYLSMEELREYRRLPSKERFAQGPVAVLECCQEIPCNPCENACPFGAIHVGSPITNLPWLDEAKCTGCGTCIAHCSGLAIFVVDKTYGKDEACVSFPHEYLPLPVKGQQVKAVDRTGTAVCDATVVRVVNAKKAAHTPVVTLAVPREFADTVRGMKRLDGYEEAADPDSCIVCRCEEITAGEIREAIAQGAGTVAEVKRRTRAGMGLCQGRTCSRIITRMIAQERQMPASGIGQDTARPPVKPVPLSAYLED